ncbi:hypothetical protein RHSIM_Rhsim12G0072100 [Rhododendron simsii]|uniref:Cytochrome P450 n=1 Tax=Rhododendron simsii TaxID=118357 RepID=A0A834G7M8_RHOSS|nr:hypothetical protein RHSIM_Rhsim12G0072100 [Rhododendron simsii]
MIITFLSTALCIFLLVALIMLLHKIWWTPIRIQHIMASQGIKGPAYRFIHGNTKEIIQMREESISNAMDFSSHDVFQRIMPHIHAWKHLYGKNYLIWHGPQAQLVVTELELIKEILNDRDGIYIKGKVDVFSKKLLGDGIVLSEGKRWSKLRKIANHAFYAESLKMSMILNETLRLYAPFTNLMRRVEREVRLGRLIIPANTELNIPFPALHHDPEIWGQDVHLFKPERFADGLAKATNNNITGFIPFGFGPRMCVGLNFAVNEAKIALSMILQRYKFTLSANYVHDPIQINIVRPRKGVQIVLSKL